MKIIISLLLSIQLIFGLDIEIKYKNYEKYGTKYIQSILDSTQEYSNIYFDDSLYILDTTLFINSNCNIILSNKTVLVQKKSIPLFVISNSNNISIAGGTLKGYKGVYFKPKNRGYKPNHIGILIKNSRNIHIKNSNLKLFRSDAIVVYNSKNVWIKENYFTQNLDNPITTSSQSEDIYILNNRMDNNDGDGILIKGGSTIIKNNIISTVGKYNFGGHGASGIALGTDNNPNKLDKIIISDNIIKNVTGFGIVNDGIKNVIISNNVISGVDGYFAIKVGNFRDANNVINGNIITNCKNGIKVDNSGVLITNNVVNNSPTVSGRPMSKFIYNNIK